MNQKSHDLSPAYVTSSRVRTVTSAIGQITLSSLPDTYTPGSTVPLIISIPLPLLSHLGPRIQIAITGTSTVPMVTSGRTKVRSPKLEVSLTMARSPVPLNTIWERISAGVAVESHLFAWTGYDAHLTAPTKVDRERNEGKKILEFDVKIPEERYCDCPGDNKDGLMGSRSRWVVWNVTLRWQKLGWLYNSDETYVYAAKGNEG
jgi:hypothetical protein